VAAKDNITALEQAMETSNAEAQQASEEAAVALTAAQSAATAAAAAAEAQQAALEEALRGEVAAAKVMGGAARLSMRVIV